MKTLTQYGLMAERHLRQFLPRMTAHLEETGQLTVMLAEAEEVTEAEMLWLENRLRHRGMTPQQAHDQAWEMVRKKYIFLPPEQNS